MFLTKKHCLGVFCYAGGFIYGGAVIQVLMVGSWGGGLYTGEGGGYTPGDCFGILRQFCFTPVWFNAKTTCFHVNS